MTWTLVQNGADAAVSSGNLTLAVSATAAATEGGLQVAAISYRGTATFTPPAGQGWTVITQDNGGNDTATVASSIASLMLAWRVVPPGASNSNVFTRTGGGAAIGH